MSSSVRITDVSPRDGLQNEPLRPDGTPIPVSEKLRLIDLVCRSGVDEVELTSFVSPKWVPQLADAAGVIAGAAALAGRYESEEIPVPEFSVLIPNAIGLAALEKADAEACEAAAEPAPSPPLIRKIGVFTAASETFAKKNTNASIAQTLERFRELMSVGSPCAQIVRGYISCVIACPFEGPIPPSNVAEVAAKLVDLGVTEIDLGDTIGAGTPDSVAEMLDAVRDRIGTGWFRRKAVVLHLHDTNGRAAECVRAALDMDVRSFDGSAGGLGGCPYASTPGRRAPGNISTELLVRTVHDAGFETGVDEDALAAAAEFARAMVGRGQHRIGGAG